MLAGRGAVRAPVRLRRAPLGSTPDLRQVIGAIADERLPFLLAGRWGLPDTADPAARTVVAGAAPAWELASDADPFAAFDDVPPLAGTAPSGTIGGGLVGWLGYGLGRSVERTLGPQPRRPAPLRAARLAWYDNVLRCDEHGVWWVETLTENGDAGDDLLAAAQSTWEARLRAAAPPAPSRVGVMAPDRGTAAHTAAIAETIERIYAGELFQANVCLRLEGALDGTAAGLVAPVLEQTDPWFGGWIDGGDGTALVSSSPELFLRRRGREVLTAPIKGTAPRAPGALDPSTDPAAGALLRSAKDHAEHVMIVDLMRNDLGRVCDYGSVRWETEPRLEPHAGVWHLVSEVGGLLHEGWGDGRLLRATFPPGSVTGAPKVQAMRVIAAVEGTGREGYTGAHGFASPAAGLELAVTIRTIELAGDRAWIGAGGGIVADSRPDDELDEALGKAGALVTAAGGTIQVDRSASPGTAPGVPWMRSDDRRPDPAAGLLETLAVDAGHPLHVAAHLERLASSAAALELPPLPADLLARVRATAADADGPSRVRIIAHAPASHPGRVGPSTLECSLELHPSHVDLAVPVPLAPVVVPGGLGPHKWLDRTLVDALAGRLHATPLLLDADGTVLEAGWANVWWLEGGTLCTPPLDGRQLPGVIRGVLLAAAERAGSPVRICEVTRAYDAGFAQLPLLLTSARGVSVAKLPGTPPHAIADATQLAHALAPLVRDPSPN